MRMDGRGNHLLSASDAAAQIEASKTSGCCLAQGGGGDV